MDFGLRDKVVAVTGGASGIGQAVVRALVADGAKVAILDGDADPLDRAMDALGGATGRAVGVRLDVRDAAALSAAVATIEASLGPVSGLVASAGVAGAARAEDISEAEFERVLSVNVTGLFLSCQAFGRRMLAHGQGAIVTIGSIDGLGGQPGRTHYTASKFAVSGLTRNLALEWGGRGVRVNGVAPTYVDTEAVRRNVPARFVEDVVCDRTPMGRMVQPSEVASVVLALLSDAMQFVNGVVLPIDGGLSAGFLTADRGDDLASNRLRAAGTYGVGGCGDDPARA